MKSYKNLLILLLTLLLLSASGCVNKTTNNYYTNGAQDYGVPTANASDDARERIDEILQRAKALAAEVKYMDALMLIENEGDRGEECIQLYESIATEYAYYIVISGTESKSNAYYILSLARAYCGDAATIIDDVEADINGMESTYSEKDAIENADGSLLPPQDTENAAPETNGKTENKVTDKTEGQTADKPQKAMTSYDRMMEFVSLKPGKWGDLDWCELYVVTIGDPNPDVDETAFIIKKGTCEADTEYLFYMANTESVDLINSFGTGHSELYCDKSMGELYRVYAHMGYGAVYRLYVDGGIREETYIAEKECASYDELIGDGWEKVKGTKLSAIWNGQ